MTKKCSLKYEAIDAAQRPSNDLPEPAGFTRLSEIAKNDSADAFRLAMRELAAGVCVITTGQGASRAGLTATSVSSLSMAPPSLLVSIQSTSSALQTLLAFGSFGVNLLAGHQSDIADRFSGRMGLQGAARFDGHNWNTGACGVPLLPTALAAVECSIERIMEWRTHFVIVGEVARVLVRSNDDPLIYWRGGYGVYAQR
jgi:flavin reductase (DIM6/NTAB) family NADH-FMN oxidoreductase RutF